jgi:hypothetical protein
VQGQSEGLVQGVVSLVRAVNTNSKIRRERECVERGSNDRAQRKIERSESEPEREGKVECDDDAEQG